MYICAGCGTAFDGRVCPKCCTMRPDAAVLGSSGRILRNREASAVPPQHQAAHFAEELEQSRQADAWRRGQQKHAEEMRSRAAQLARAAEQAQQRQHDPQPATPAQHEKIQPTEEELRYARQAQKATHWQRKAPAARSALQEEAEVELPQALRSLKIDSRHPDRPAAHRADDASSPRAASAPYDRYGGRTMYPSCPQVPQRKGNNSGRASAVRSERIDAAWRSFAGKEAASGKPVTPRLQDNTGHGMSAPKPPAAPDGGK